jgi:hypothetical protein
MNSASANANGCHAEWRPFDSNYDCRHLPGKAVEVLFAAQFSPFFGAGPSDKLTPMAELMRVWARLSLRGLLLFVAAAAVGSAALRFANDWWLAGAVGALLITITTAAIVAVVGLGARKAGAAGFTIAAGIYLFLALLFSAGYLPRNANPEFDPYIGRLPTTQLLRPAFAMTVSYWTTDLRTGEELPSKPPLNPRQLVSFSGVLIRERPDRGHFMQIGHCLWAMVMGFLGSRFAQFVHGRREREESNSV